MYICMYVGLPNLVTAEIVKQVTRSVDLTGHFCLLVTHFGWFRFIDL